MGLSLDDNTIRGVMVLNVSAFPVGLQIMFFFIITQMSRLREAKLVLIITSIQCFSFVKDFQINA